LHDTEYPFAQWKQCRAGVDYHVEIERHYYSVPYTLVRQELWARYTASTVEVFHRGKRVAVHRRGPPNRGHPPCPSTCPRAIGAMPTGRFRAPCARPLRSGLTPPHSSKSSCARSDTPSRASAPAAAS